MYIVDSFTGAKAKEVAIAAPPFGAGFDSKRVENIDSLTVMGTSFNDPGPDYCVFIACDNQFNVIAQKKIKGY
jgi:hypothetical protein